MAKKVNIVYASMTGNTEEIASIVKEQFDKKGFDVQIFEAPDVDINHFIKGDILIVASYTYGQGDLPDEINEFYSELKNTQLNGKKYGVIGSGDTSYGDYFGKAVELFDEVLSNSGGVKGTDNVKIEFDANDDDKVKIEKFVSDLSQ